MQIPANYTLPLLSNHLIPVGNLHPILSSQAV